MRRRNGSVSVYDYQPILLLLAAQPAGLQQAGRGHHARDPAGDPGRDDPHAIVATLLDACRPAATSPSLTQARTSSTRKRSREIGDSWNGRVQQQFTFRSRDQ